MVEDKTLYDQAVLRVAQAQKVSALFLQSTLEIDYQKAIGLIDRMETDGLVSATDFHGRRLVLIDSHGLVRGNVQSLQVLCPVDGREPVDYLRLVLIGLLGAFLLSIVIMAFRP